MRSDLATDHATAHRRDLRRARRQGRAGHHRSGRSRSSSRWRSPCCRRQPCAAAASWPGCTRSARPSSRPPASCSTPCPTPRAPLQEALQAYTDGLTNSLYLEGGAGGLRPGERGALVRHRGGVRVRRRRAHRRRRAPHGPAPRQPAGGDRSVHGRRSRLTTPCSGPARLRSPSRHRRRRAASR